MKYTIQWETSWPSYASEADKERGADAYRAVIESHHHIAPARIVRADRLRGEVDDVDDVEALDVLDEAESAAERAVTEGWADQNADSGVSYRIDLEP